MAALPIRQAKGGADEECDRCVFGVGGVAQSINKIVRGIEVAAQCMIRQMM